MLNEHLDQMLAVDASLHRHISCEANAHTKWCTRGEHIVAAYQVYRCKLGNFAAAVSIKNAKQAAVGVKV